MTMIVKTGRNAYIRLSSIDRVPPGLEESDLPEYASNLFRGSEFGVEGLDGGYLARIPELTPDKRKQLERENYVIL
jgi:hypothetical protein